MLLLLFSVLLTLKVTVSFSNFFFKIVWKMILTACQWTQILWSIVLLFITAVCPLFTGIWKQIFVSYLGKIPLFAETNFATWKLAMTSCSLNVLLLLSKYCNDTGNKSKYIKTEPNISQHAIAGPSRESQRFKSPVSRQKCTQLFFQYEAYFQVWPCYRSLELEGSVIFMIIIFVGFSFYLLHNIIRTISNSSKMSLQTLLCQICRTEHCMGYVIAEHSKEHLLLDSKLGGAASKLED